MKRRPKKPPCKKWPSKSSQETSSTSKMVRELHILYLHRLNRCGFLDAACPKVLVFQLLLGISYHHTSLTYAGGTLCVVSGNTRCVCYLVGVLKKPKNTNNIFGAPPKAFLVRLPLTKKAGGETYPGVFITDVGQVTLINQCMSINHPYNHVWVR